MPERYFILLRHSVEGSATDPKDYKARDNFEIHELRSLNGLVSIIYEKTSGYERSLDDARSKDKSH